MSLIIRTQGWEETLFSFIESDSMDGLSNDLYL